MLAADRRRWLPTVAGVNQRSRPGALSGSRRFLFPPERLEIVYVWMRWPPTAVIRAASEGRRLTPSFRAIERGGGRRKSPVTYSSDKSQSRDWWLDGAQEHAALSRRGHQRACPTGCGIRRACDQRAFHANLMPSYPRLLRVEVALAEAAGLPEGLRWPAEGRMVQPGRENDSHHKYFRFRLACFGGFSATS